MRTVAPPRNWHIVHGDVIGITLCGRACPTPPWTLVNQAGSLHSITCRLCIRCLLASGDLPDEERAR